MYYFKAENLPIVFSSIPIINIKQYFLNYVYSRIEKYPIIQFVLNNRESIELIR